MAKRPSSETDPVTQYATDVVNGVIVAGRLVRLACQRHLNDLKDAAAKGLVWKPEEARRVIRFYETILRLPENVSADDAVDEDVDLLALEGKPFVLSPYQQFFIGSLIGWYTTKGFRRFRAGVLETGKGSGKTPMGAGLMIYLTIADGERGAQVFVAAAVLSQAKIAFTDVERMVEASPSLRRVFDPTVNNLAYPRTGSFIRAISSEKRGLDGKRVHGALIDEVQEQPTSVVVDKVRAGTKGRRNALIVMTGNSGYDRHSVWWSIHEYSAQVLEGVVENDSWFAYMCQLDACDSCLAAGKQQPSETCPTCDDWRIEGPHWLKVNPNLGVSLPWEYLREQVREAIAMPSKQNTVKRLNFCIWTEQVTVWIPIDRWTRCQSARVTAESLEKRECYLGCDLSAKIDLSSVQAVFPRPLAAAAPLVAGRDGQEITRAIDVLSYFWMPELTLQQRAREDNMPYVEWRNAGYLFATAGALIDHDAIADFIIQVLAKRFRVRGIGVDQAGATAFVTRLQRHFGDELVTEVPQGFKMLSGPSKTLEALVMSENVAHDGNPVMAMCVGNMGKEENSWQEIRPVKLSPRKRIDGGVALIDGICTMERTPAEEESVYARRGGFVSV